MARVLIADDVSDTRLRLTAALRDHGYEVGEYPSGWELLEALGEDPTTTDLVVTDSRMGFPDGLSVATLARAGGATCPFIVLTGIANERARKVARGLGDVVLVEPPAELDRILEVVAYAIERPETEELSQWVGAASLFTDNEARDDQDD